MFWNLFSKYFGHREKKTTQVFNDLTNTKNYLQLFIVQKKLQDAGFALSQAYLSNSRVGNKTESEKQIFTNLRRCALIDDNGVIHNHVKQAMEEMDFINNLHHVAGSDLSVPQIKEFLLRSQKWHSNYQEWKNEFG